MKTRRIDGVLVAIVAVLIISGALIFASAALGLLARGFTNVPSVAFNHIVFGIVAGLVALAATSLIDYHIWQRFALHLFLLAISATALVFVPSLGIMHGGGTRWIGVSGFTFQPSELLKIGSVMITAAYVTAVRTHIHFFSRSIGGLCAILAMPVALLLLQPDLGTLGVIVASVIVVIWSAGARMRDLLFVVLIALLALGILAMTRPYVMDRLLVFFDPTRAPLAEGYQIKQSLIAIGSGGLTGRGFGQSVQKFTYLPEPMGDSVFAVVAEELGFIGSTALVGLFIAFALRGFTVSTRAPDLFGTLLGIGITAYLSIEAFVNMGAMLGIIPLTGIPLTFVSQGGSAMLVSLASVGILFNISRRTRTL